MNNAYPLLTKELKSNYIIFKLLSREGFSYQEMIDDLGLSKSSIKRALASVREALYLVYNDDVQLIFDKKTNRYYLIIHKQRNNYYGYPLIK